MSGKPPPVTMKMVDDLMSGKSTSTAKSNQMRNRLQVASTFGKSTKKGKQTYVRP